KGSSFRITKYMIRVTALIAGHNTELFFLHIIPLERMQLDSMVMRGKLLFETIGSILHPGNILWMASVAVRIFLSLADFQALIQISMIILSAIAGTTPLRVKE